MSLPGGAQATARGPAGLGRVLLWALCALAVPGLALARPALADRLQEVLERGVLAAGVKDGAPPFAFRNPDGNRLEGFEPDLVRAVAERLGVTARLTVVAPGERLSRLADGSPKDSPQATLDVVAAGLVHTLSREERVDFSVTYFMDGPRLLVPAASGLREAADLAGGSAAVVAGDAAQAALASAQPDCVVTALEGWPQAFLALKSGRVQALAADATMLLFLKNADSEPGRWAVAGRPLALRPWAMALPENESGLRDAVNKALLELWASGQYRRIYGKWFGPKTPYYLPLHWRMEAWPP